MIMYINKNLYTYLMSVKYHNNKNKRSTDKRIIKFLPYNVVNADNTRRLLLFVEHESGLCLHPGISTRFGEKTISSRFALSLGEYCEK